MSTSVVEAQKQIRINDTQVIIRPIRHTDTVLEEEFIAGLSASAKRFRKMGGIRQLTDEQIHNLCDVDYHESMAYVATVFDAGHDKEIGVARYTPGDKIAAHEMAIVIADDYRDTKLGRALLQNLIDYARHHGIKVLYTIDQNDNVFMRSLAEDIKMSVRLDPDDPHQVIYTLIVDKHPERVTL